MKKGLIYILLTAVVFTTLEPISKMIAKDINPFAITCIRFLIGGAVLLPFSIKKLKEKKIKLEAKDILIMTLLGVLCICVSMVLLQFAVLKADSPALIAIIFSSNSVFTILFAVFILKDTMSVRKCCAIALCIIGVLACADFSSGSNLLSIVLSVLAALTFSLYTVLSKKYMTKISGIVQTGISFFIGSLILLVYLLIMKIDIWGAVNYGNIWNLLYLGIVVTGIGYWAYFRGMEKTSAMAASFVFFIKPILTPFATFLLLGIVPGIKVFLSLALVLGGSYLTTMQPKKDLMQKSL